MNKESVVAVFFDIEKAYDMKREEGLLIKLNHMGIKGSVFTWVKEFLLDKTIMVKINGVTSERYQVDNCILQGSIISLLLFSIMINEHF